MTRLMVMTFWSNERFPVTPIDNLRADDNDDHAQVNNLRHHKPHESPLSMTIPLIVLAILSTIGGLIGVPYALSSLAGGRPANYFERTLEPVVSHPHEGTTPSEATSEVHWQTPPPQESDGKPAFGLAHDSAGDEPVASASELNEERMFTLISVVIALLGIGIGWLMFQRQPIRRMPRLLENKYYVDEAYDAAIIKPIHVTSREGLWKIFDLGVIDGFLHTLGRTVVDLGRTFRYMQIGLVRGYAAIILAGALIIIGYFAYHGAQLLMK
jgi:NADH-quinone oxidoreductase subunit L